MSLEDSVANGIQAEEPTSSTTVTSSPETSPPPMVGPIKEHPILLNNLAPLSPSNHSSSTSSHPLQNGSHPLTSSSSSPASSPVTVQPIEDIVEQISLKEPTLPTVSPPPHLNEALESYPPVEGSLPEPEDLTDSPQPELETLKVDSSEDKDESESSQRSSVPSVPLPPPPPPSPPACVKIPIQEKSVDGPNKQDTNCNNKSDTNNQHPKVPAPPAPINPSLRKNLPACIDVQSGRTRSIRIEPTSATTTFLEPARISTPERSPTPAASVSDKQKMNGLSFSEICYLFCCPPCPGQIAAKLAFLPPEPTYTFLPDETNTKFTLSLTERAEWQYSPRELDNIEVFYARTDRGNRVGCMFIRAPNPKFTILFSHGNAIDLGQMSSFYLGLGARINCNIFSYDYSGYGVSSGSPSEKNLYADIDAAWRELRARYGISPEHIIIYGQSIGTVPTVDLASRYEVGGVILHSPLMSGLRVAFPQTKRTWFFDAFPSIDKVSKVTAPVLVIHGTEDEVIDFSHGLAIYEKCPRAVEPLWVEGAGHNDVELYGQYLERLKTFLSVDLANN